MVDGGDPLSESRIPSWITEVPKALVPASLKALDRLIGATADIPIAYLRRHTARVYAQTETFKAVEAAIGKAVADRAGAEGSIIEQAMSVLVRKEYRRQENRTSVARAFIADIADTAPSAKTADAAPPDDDWLNVFERFAEDASTERMQTLWGRVLAGEVRQPGKFSLRALRFVSEFSQIDAELFSIFMGSCFSGIAPYVLVKPGNENIQPLMHLEAAGLVSGSISGVRITNTFDETGHVVLSEGGLILILEGNPGDILRMDVIPLTPLGREMSALLPSRDLKLALNRVATSIRSPTIKSAKIGTLTHRAGDRSDYSISEQLWDQNTPYPGDEPESAGSASP